MSALSEIGHPFKNQLIRTLTTNQIAERLLKRKHLLYKHYPINDKSIFTSYIYTGMPNPKKNRNSSYTPATTNVIESFGSNAHQTQITPTSNAHEP